MSVFSERLRQLRISRNMPQKELAIILHVHRSTVAGYETKERVPDLQTIIRIAETFDVTVDYLIGRI